MATRPIPGFSNWYYDFQSLEDYSLPLLWWPVIMYQSRSPSLLQRHFRYTLGLGRWRWSVILVEKKQEPDLDFSSPELSVNEWIRWSANWSKGKLRAEDIHALIRQEDQPWGRLVKFGAANYHYGRLILAREALSQSRSKKEARKTSARQSGEIEMSLELDLPQLSLPDPSIKVSPPAPAQEDGDHENRGVRE